jgi:hypothetical protein
LLKEIASAILTHGMARIDIACDPHVDGIAPWAGHVVGMNHEAAREADRRKPGAPGLKTGI